jgi:hypothetical protein
MANKRVSENKLVVSPAGAVRSRRKSASPKRVARPLAVESSNPPAFEPEVVPVAPVAAMVTPAESFQDAVARLAYSYWEARGCQGGSPEADWLRAEQELRAK